MTDVTTRRWGVVCGLQPVEVGREGDPHGRLLDGSPEGILGGRPAGVDAGSRRAKRRHALTIPLALGLSARLLPPGARFTSTMAPPQGPPVGPASRCPHPGWPGADAAPLPHSNLFPSPGVARAHRAQPWRVQVQVLRAFPGCVPRAVDRRAALLAAPPSGPEPGPRHADKKGRQGAGSGWATRRPRTATSQRAAERGSTD